MYKCEYRGLKNQIKVCLTLGERTEMKERYIRQLDQQVEFTNVKEHTKTKHGNE